ncbi:hypothetical protein SLEP1_g27868 [Rubroshorea leprosula]|uniref:Uncharacterized protein n=1 Tax=Rubroshorea leprosula TaxID=152421 RepID=A0AAV5JXU4_9ROSI|nr:hypothetical protein SLEP1_g27868 [Rubroshorea leprosula]
MQSPDTLLGFRIDLVAEDLGSPLSQKRKLSTHSHLGSHPFPTWELFAGD